MKTQIIKEHKRGDKIHVTQTKFTLKGESYIAHRRILRNGEPTFNWVRIHGHFSIADVRAY